MLNLPKRILVTEVAPRDGLQSLSRWIDTDLKVAMIDRLSTAGFPVIEVTSFAHPRVVPHLKDAEEVCARIMRRRGTLYRALVPNARGTDRAVAAKVDEVLGLITVSATYLKHNQNMTIDQAVEQAVQSFRIADKAGIGFVMALGMSMWCPYEGLIPEQNVHNLIGRFRDAGMRRFYLAGSMGMEDPRQVGRLFAGLGDCYPDCDLGFHVHNLAGYGSANVLAAIDAGARWIEGSICGIGGGVAVPADVGSVGNLPTEDIVAMLDEMGIETGLDVREVVSAARDVARLLDIEPRSHVLRAGTRAEILRRGSIGDSKG
jgi:hydroxymethylglutaryl-CoA lyase